MTRKHCELIAALLREELEQGFMRSKRQHGIRCNMWADELEKHNSGFNRYQFLKSCGVLS